MLAHLVLVLLLSLHRVTQLILRNAAGDAWYVMRRVLKIALARRLLILDIAVHTPRYFRIVLTVHDCWLVGLLQSGWRGGLQRLGLL